MSEAVGGTTPGRAGDSRFPVDVSVTRPRTEDTGRQDEGLIRGGAEKAAENVVESTLDQRAFLYNEQKYLCDYIRFADQKAAFISAASVGLLSYLASQRVYRDAFTVPLYWLQHEPLMAVGSLLLLAACFLSAMAVLPRRTWKDLESLVFWEGVRRYDSADSYCAALTTYGAKGLNRQLAQHCYSLAAVCTRKYQYVNLAMWLTGIGSLLTWTSLVGRLELGIAI